MIDIKYFINLLIQAGIVPSILIIAGFIYVIILLIVMLYYFFRFLFKL